MSESNLTAKPSSAPAHVILAPLLLVGAGIAVYANSLSGVFLFDDYKHVVENEAIRDLWSPGAYLADRRPVVQATFAINYAVSALAPWSYHVLSVMIHLAAALTLYGIVRRTIRFVRRGQASEAQSAWLAWVVALLWLVHPLQTQCVTYVVQRGEALMGFFYLLCLYAVIRAESASRSWPWCVIAVMACAAGMASKAVMITAPLVVLLYDRMFLASSWSVVVRRRGVLYVALMATWSVLILCGVAQAVLPTEPKPGANVGFGYTGISPFAYAMTQPLVILYYLRLALWPNVLCLDYQWQTVSSLGSTAGPGLVVAALVLATLGAIAARHWLGFAGAWFFLILAPTSTIVPIKDVIFEHRMYLPLAAVVVLVVFGLYGALTYVFGKQAHSVPFRTATAALLIAVAAISLGLRTVRRNQDYHSAVAMWQSVIDVRPHSDRAYLGMGVALYREGRVEESRPYFREAIKLTPKYADAHYNLGVAAAALSDWSTAVASFRRATALAPLRVRYGLALGDLLSYLGRYEEAADAYRAVVAAGSESARAVAGLANALADAGRDTEAVVAFERALAIDPGSVDVLINLGNALRRLERREEAIVRYQRAIALDGQSAAAHANLGAASAELGRYDEAATALTRAIELDPNSLPSYRALATVFMRQGDNAEARTVLEELLRRDPGNALAEEMLRGLSGTAPGSDATNGESNP